MTAVVERAEKAGKHVTPLIVPTNNPSFALVSSARQLKAQELIVGMSNINTADEQLDQLAFYWFSLEQGPTAPITIRILSRDRDVHLDLAGGSRIPRISERQARSVSELRAAGVGVDRVFLVHENTRWGSDHVRIGADDPRSGRGLGRRELRHRRAANRRPPPGRPGSDAGSAIGTRDHAHHRRPGSWAADRAAGPLLAITT